MLAWRVFGGIGGEGADMIFSILKKVNRYLPENLRLFLLSYYRNIFSGLRNILFMPQLNCNFHCEYCIWMRFVREGLKSAYHPYREWVEVFEKLPPSVFTITGGEPLLYKDIVPLINNFPSKHLISCLVSNLSLNIDKLLATKHRNFRIMASFHPSMTSKEEFLHNLLLIKKGGLRNVTINFVAHPRYLNDILALKRYFEKACGFYFRVDTFKDPYYQYSRKELLLIRQLKQKGIIAKDRTEGYDFSDFSLKSCCAGSTYFLIAADGGVYSCVEGFYYCECQPYRDKYNPKDIFYLGNIFDGSFQLSSGKRQCHSPCAELCDLELAGVKKIKE